MIRMVWCTPGRIDEADLISAASAAGATVVRRCVDAADLLAAASIEADAIVVIDASVPRLGSDIVASIHSSGPERIVGLTDGPSARDHLTSLGVSRFVDACGADPMGQLLAACSAPRSPRDSDVRDASASGARVLAITGPPGAPGRSAVALGVAEAFAQAGERVCIVDADTLAPSLATIVGMTEDVSGLLLATRYADQGALDARSLGSSCRRLAEGLWIMTGIGSPDRWGGIRRAALDRVWESCRAHFDRVVIDAGVLVDSTQADDPLHAHMQERDTATRSALATSDDALVVCEPTALSVLRLIQALPAIGQNVTHESIHVLVNRVQRRDRRARERVREALGDAGLRTPIHSVVDDDAVRSCIAKGALLSEVGRATKVKRDLRNVARTLAA